MGPLLGRSQRISFHMRVTIPVIEKLPYTLNDLGPSCIRWMLEMVRKVHTEFRSFNLWRNNHERIFIHVG